MKMLSVEAPAKINLTLDILGRRPDGYHELEMVMQTVSLYDTVEVRAETGRGGIAVETDQPNLTCGPDNLACRAAAEFFRSTGFVNSGVEISIRKRIPMQAGLAGGSTDGAAVLRALRALLAPELADEELERMGARIGSDVPFCIRGGTALARGRGEKLTPLAPLPDCRIVLCKPAFGLSTPVLFARTDSAALSCRPDSRALSNALSRGDLAASAACAGNVFEQVLTSEERRIIAGLEAVLHTWDALCAVMTGSGPTVFGLFPPEREMLSRRAQAALSGPSTETFLVHPCKI